MKQVGSEHSEEEEGAECAAIQCIISMLENISIFYTKLLFTAVIFQLM